MANDIGRIQQFMDQYQRDRVSDREEARKWREEFAIELKETKSLLGNLKERVDNLTAPARWAVGFAAIVTALGAIATFWKKIIIWFRALVA